MDLYDITQLSPITGSTGPGNYDLTQLTFQYLLDGTVLYSQYQVQAGEEMRMDLVCQSIYNNTTYVDLLCNINNIDNPLNIKEGQIIYYAMTNQDLLRYSETDLTNTVTSVANSNKSTRKDTSRQQYLQNNQSLPPTILPQRLDPVNISGSRFVLGEGLFNNT